MLMAKCLDDNEIELPCSVILGNDFDLHIKAILALDLVNVFSSAYASDISVSQNNRGREINFSTPISKDNIGIWYANKALINSLLNYVTESDSDRWNIEFYPVDYISTERVLNTTIKHRYDNVSLLSGGLDSFCGICDNEARMKTAIYCGYKTNNIDASYIGKMTPVVGQFNPGSFVRLFNKINIKKVTHTQRTRSLLFFSLACFTAIQNGIDTLNVYENGIMTLNPSFESRGTTKTTHPKTIFLFQQLLNNSNINVTIAHPFLFMTKGEMLSKLPNKYLNHIVNTRSCSRSLQNKKYTRKGVSSCGACVPCLLRKISIAAYDMEQHDHDYFIPYSGDILDVEYNSAYSYFKRFSHAIDEGTIFANFEMKRAFYDVVNYYEQTNLMLNRFNVELKKFFDKYGR